MAHLQAELRHFPLDQDDWVGPVAHAIRPALAMYDSDYADPSKVSDIEIADPLSGLGEEYYGLYVAEELKAFTALYPSHYNTNGRHVGMLAVPQTTQRQGWGSALLVLAEAISKEEGYESMTLIAPPSSQGFYTQKHGYVIDTKYYEPEVEDKYLIKVL